MKRSKALKRIWNIISTVIVVLAVILAVLLAGVRLFGLQPYAVLSGSMRPEYNTGDLIYVKSVDADTLKVDDIITFAVDETTIATHRIIEIINDESEPDVLRFRTQGDANPTPDGKPVHEKNVIGKPVFHIPLLGFLSYFITTPPYTYISIGIAAVLIFIVFLPDIIFAPEKSGKRKKSESCDGNDDGSDRGASE